MPMTESDRNEALERQVAELVERLARSQEQTEHALANTDKAIAQAKEAITLAQSSRKEAERYRFLKTRLEVPGAVDRFLALNNWHPSTDMRDVDAAIDKAMLGEPQRDEGKS